MEENRGKITKNDKKQRYREEKISLRIIGQEREGKKEENVKRNKPETRGRR